MLPTDHAMLVLNSSPFSSESTAPRPSTLVKESGVSSDAGRVYGEIFDGVMDRRLLPGTKLTEAALCKAFSCSRATVRSALAQLAHDKIVDIRLNRGAYVYAPNLKEAQDVFEMRRVLECVVIEKLMGFADLSHRLRPLHDMVEREQGAFEAGDRISWLRLSHAFHVTLAGLLGNGVLTELLHGLCARSAIIIAYHDTPGQHTCSYIEHKAILDLLVGGDRDQVSRAMDAHLQACELRVAKARPTSADPWLAFGTKF